MHGFSTPSFVGMISFRRAVEDDAAAMARLVSSFQPTLTIDPSGDGAEEFLSSMSEASFQSYLTSPRYTYLVADHGGVLIGFGALREDTHLYHLFVDAEFQKRGIARALWNRLMSTCTQVGCGPVFTVNASPGSVPVYDRMGFVVSGPRVETHGIAFVPMKLQSEITPPNKRMERGGDE
jgi:GNAT superfamily N-acetyltransferase